MKEMVLVEWEDAYIEGAEVWEHSPDPPTACIVRQVGWLVHQDAERFALVSGYCDDAAQTRFVIPRGMVRSMTLLTASKKQPAGYSARKD